MKSLTRLFSSAGVLFGVVLAGGVSAEPPPAPPSVNEADAVRVIRIVVDGGYTPNRIEIVEAQRVRLEFLRKDSSSCTREVIFPTLGIEKELPTNEVVTVELPPLRAGEYAFLCGMKMVKGSIIVRAKG